MTSHDLDRELFPFNVVSVLLCSEILRDLQTQKDQPRGRSVLIIRTDVSVLILFVQIWRSFS